MVLLNSVARLMILGITRQIDLECIHSKKQGPHCDRQANYGFWYGVFHAIDENKQKYNANEWTHQQKESVALADMAHRFTKMDKIIINEMHHTIRRISFQNREVVIIQKLSY